MRELSITCDLGDISSDFNLEQKILGPKGKNLEFIEKKTGAIISLNWSTETLGRVDFKIAHNNVKDLNQAEKFVQSLIRSVKNDYMKYLENEYSEIKDKVDTVGPPVTQKPPQLMSSSVRQPIRCEPCNMTISSQLLFDLHLKSIGHLQKVKPIQDQHSQQTAINRIYVGKLGGINQSNPQNQPFQGNQHQQISPQKFNQGGPSPLHGLYGNRNNQSAYTQGGNQQFRGGNQGFNSGNQQGFNSGNQQGFNAGNQGYNQANNSQRPKLGQNSSTGAFTSPSNQNKRDTLSRTELRNFIAQQMESKNASFMLNLEKKMTTMIQQNYPQGKLTFLEPSGYKRLLIHRAAEYFHLSHEVSGEKMIVGFTSLARERKETPFKDFVQSTGMESLQSSSQVADEMSGIPLEEVAKSFYDTKDQARGMAQCRICKITILGTDQQRSHLFSISHAHNLAQMISTQATPQPVQMTCSRMKIKMRAVKAVVMHHRDLIKLPKEALFELKLDEPLGEDRRSKQGQAGQMPGSQFSKAPSGMPGLHGGSGSGGHQPSNVMPLMSSGPGMMGRPSGVMGMMPPASMHSVMPPVGMMMPPPHMQQPQMQQAQLQQAQLQQAQLQQAQMQQAQMQQAQMQQAQMQQARMHQQPPQSPNTSDVAQKLAASVQEALSSGQSTGQLAMELQRNLLDKMGSAPSGEQKLLTDTLFTLTELLKQQAGGPSDQDRSKNDGWKPDNSNQGQEDRKRKGLDDNEGGPRPKYSRDDERQFGRGSQGDSQRDSRNTSRWNDRESNVDDRGRNQRDDDWKGRDNSPERNRWERGQDRRDWNRRDSPMNIDDDRRERGASREIGQNTERRTDRWGNNDEDRGRRGQDSTGRRDDTDRWERDVASRERRADSYERESRSRISPSRQIYSTLKDAQDSKSKMDMAEAEHLERQRRIASIERETMIARLEALDRLEREEMYRRDPFLDKLPRDLLDASLDSLKGRDWSRLPDDPYRERTLADPFKSRLLDDRTSEDPYRERLRDDPYMKRLPERKAEPLKDEDIRRDDRFVHYDADERRPPHQFGGAEADDMQWRDDNRHSRDNRQQGGKGGEGNSERKDTRRGEENKKRDDRRDRSPSRERRDRNKPFTQKEPAQKITQILEMLPLTSTQKEELLRVLPPNFTPELLADFHTMLIDSLKILVRKLQNPVTGPNGQPLRMSDLPPESREMIQQVQKMTGMQSLGNIGVTLNIVTALQEMDPNIVEVLGALDPEILNSLVSSIPGATEALAQLFTALRSMRGEAAPEGFSMGQPGGGRGRGNAGMQQKGGRRGGQGNQQRGGNRGGGFRGRGGRGRRP